MEQPETNLDRECIYVKELFLRKFSEKGISGSPYVLSRLAEGVLIQSYISYDLYDVLSDFHNSQIQMIEKVFKNWNVKDDDNSIKIIQECLEEIDSPVVHLHIEHPYTLDINKLSLLIEEIQKKGEDNREVKLQLIPKHIDNLVIRIFSRNIK